MGTDPICIVTSSVNRESLWCLLYSAYELQCLIWPYPSRKESDRDIHAHDYRPHRFYATATTW
jgi:hypothetical protein